MFKSKSKKITAAAGALLVAIGAGIYFHLQKEQPGTVTLKILQTQGADAIDGWKALSAEFYKTHPHIALSVSYIDPSHLESPSFDVLVSDPAAMARHGLAGQDLYEDGYQVLYYNRSLATSVPESWETLAQAAWAQTKGAEERYGLAWPDDTFAIFPLFATALSGHQDPATAARLGFEALDLVRFVYPATPLGCHASCAARIFTGGRSPYAIAGEWRLAEFQTAFGDKLGVAPLPGSAVSMRQTMQYGAAPELSGERLKAYEEWSRFLQSEAGMRLMFKTLHKLPSLAVKGNVSLQDPLGDELRVAAAKTISLSKDAYEEHLQQLTPIVDDFKKGHIGIDQAVKLLIGTLQKSQ
ncbi:MAG: extracellular solute-binding protein [Pseudobdellovibrionaceae bacterium]|nr:extracellular solute-binding protein [Pseudobdellovibrionaceae bacterium]